MVRYGLQLKMYVLIISYINKHDNQSGKKCSLTIPLLSAMAKDIKQHLIIHNKNLTVNAKKKKKNASPYEVHLCSKTSPSKLEINNLQEKKRILKLSTS